MAKISANGDTEAARWRRKPQGSSPAAPYEMVLTAKGRLLYKQARGGSFTLRRRGVTMTAAGAQAATFGMVSC